MRQVDYTLHSKRVARFERRAASGLSIEKVAKKLKESPTQYYASRKLLRKKQGFGFSTVPALPLPEATTKVVTNSETPTQIQYLKSMASKLRFTADKLEAAAEELASL